MLLGYQWKNSTWNLLPDNEKGKQLQSAFISFVEAISAKKPLVLLIDDLQWLDGDSRILLEALSAKATGSVHVLACLDADCPEEATELHMSGHTHYDLELGALDDDACESLLKSQLQRDNISQSTLEGIRNLSEGNPLYLQQYACYLLESKGLVS